MSSKLNGIRIVGWSDLFHTTPPLTTQSFPQLLLSVMSLAVCGCATAIIILSGWGIYKGNCNLAASCCCVRKSKHDEHHPPYFRFYGSSGRWNNVLQEPQQWQILTQHRRDSTYTLCTALLLIDLEVIARLEIAWIYSRDNSPNKIVVKAILSW